MHPSQQNPIQFLDIERIGTEFDRRVRLLSDAKAMKTRAAEPVPTPPTHVESPKDWQDYQSAIRQDTERREGNQEKIDLWTKEAAAIEQNIVRAFAGEYLGKGEQTLDRLSFLRLAWISTNVGGGIRQTYAHPQTSNFILMIYRLWTANGNGKIHLMSGRIYTLCGSMIETVGHAYSYHIEIGRDGSLNGFRNAEFGANGPVGHGVPKTITESEYCPDCIRSARKGIQPPAELPGDSLFDF